MWFWVAMLVVPLLASPVVAAEELSVKAQVDRSELRQGEALNFSVTLTGPFRGTPRVDLGSLEGFRVLSTGQSQEVRMRGRRMMQMLTLTYVLTPVRAGTLTLGPIKVEAQGSVYETQSFEVKVLPGEAAPEPGEGRPPKPELRGGITL